MLDKTESTWIETIVVKMQDLIGKTQDIILVAAGFIVIIMMVIGGIQYITGKPEEGKKTILAAVIGSIIIVLAWSIYRAVLTLFPIAL